MRRSADQQLLRWHKKKQAERKRKRWGSVSERKDATKCMHGFVRQKELGGIPSHVRAPGWNLPSAAVYLHPCLAQARPCLMHPQLTPSSTVSHVSLSTCYFDVCAQSTPGRWQCPKPQHPRSFFPTLTLETHCGIKGESLARRLPPHRTKDAGQFSGKLPSRGWCLSCLCLPSPGR